MTYLRRLLLSLCLSAGIAPALAQAPPPVPALPDTERRTTYSISGTTCACAVNMDLYGDSTDFQNWVEVLLNGARVNFNDVSFGWTITVPTGSLSTRSRPISDAVLTFTSVQTGTVQIVGARRPRRTSQFSENQGVSARSLNQVFTDIIAQNREIWDKTNDVTGRAPLVPAGESLALLPALALRQSKGACFDSGGNLTSCVSVPSTTIAAGAGITLTGTNPATITTNFAAGTGITLTGSNPITITAVGSGSGNVVGPASSTFGHIATFGNSAGTLLADGGPFANPSASIGLTANNGVAVTAMRSDATPALSQSIVPTWTGLHTFQAGIAVNPTPASLGTAINTTQTLAGTTAVPYAANLFAINTDVANAGANFVLGWDFGMLYGGGAMQGGRQTISGFGTLTAPSNASSPLRSYVGVTGSMTAQSADNGTNPAASATAKGAFFGGNFAATAQNGATALHNITGTEFNVAMQAGSSVWAKTLAQFSSNTTDAVSGSAIDSMLWMYNQTGATSKWSNGIRWDDAGGQGLWPFNSSSTIIQTGGSGTANTGIDFSNTTFTGNAFKSTGFSVDPAGNVSANNIGTVASQSYTATSWTPTLIGSTSGSWTLSTAVGSYEKIGRHINIRFTIVASGSTSPAGNVTIGGIPVTSANVANDNGICSIAAIGGWTSGGGYTLPAGIVPPNSPSISLTESGSAVAIRIMPVTSLGATPTIEGMCVYHN